MATPEFITNAAGESAKAEVMGGFVDANFLITLGLGALVYFGLFSTAGHARGKAVDAVKDTVKSARG